MRLNHLETGSVRVSVSSSLFMKQRLYFGMMLKHFDFEDHTNYELDIKETLTLKPEGFVVKAKSKQIPLGGIPSPS